jgi:hypothetical protein
MNRTQKVDRSFVIPGGNSTILLELGEKVLNQMPRFVQILVVLTWMLSVLSRRNSTVCLSPQREFIKGNANAIRVKNREILAAPSFMF